MCYHRRNYQINTLISLNMVNRVLMCENPFYSEQEREATHIMKECLNEFLFADFNVTLSAVLI